MSTPVMRKEDHSVKKVNPVHFHYPFWFGGSASCFAAAVTHPLDLIKVRLQTRTADGPKGMLGTFVHIFKTSGVLGLYPGLSASLLRQATYSTTRFGIYSELKEAFTTARSSPSLPSLIAIASTSGFLGGIAGNPADVVNVRMQHDASLPPQKQRNYKNAIDGMVRMFREEGWRSLFRGVWPNSMRAVLMTASQLASYDSFKKVLLDNTSLEDNLTTHFTASFMAGFVATTVCSPVDVIKTRVMSAKDSEGMVSLLTRTIKAEGVGWMFRGWVPSFVRLGPHTIATFLFLEQHKKVYRYMKRVDD
ncbi:Mitochondrial dicarboxylate transporter [Mycoblastus sanguinarius]|nr:Mitochondrial dicarboxylate transporter [Mycoblastus sanguinarius]